jgi:hypothetical protein
LVATAQQQLREAHQLKQDAKDLSFNAHRRADEFASQQINEGLQVFFFFHCVLIFLC